MNKVFHTSSPHLGRMGNSRSALKMIMEELHDVDKAIEFAKEQDDGELWEDLILYSIDKPRKQRGHLTVKPLVSIIIACYVRKNYFMVYWAKIRARWVGGEV